MDICDVCLVCLQEFYVHLVRRCHVLSCNNTTVAELYCKIEKGQNQLTGSDCFDPSYKW